MMDVLITQHARWTARRIKRALFGQSLIKFSSDSWARVLLDTGTRVSTQRSGMNFRHSGNLRLVRQFSSFSVLGDSPEFCTTEQEEVQAHVIVDFDKSDKNEQLMPSDTEEQGQKSSEFSPAASVLREEYWQKSSEFSTAPSAPSGLGTEVFDLSSA